MVRDRGPESAHERPRRRRNRVSPGVTRLADPSSAPAAHEKRLDALSRKRAIGQHVCFEAP
jgi:hypothetical protein